MAVLKLTGLEAMTRKTTKVKQAKSYPTASVLYCTYANLPESLSSNALIFTTDTAELFVGTGTGIQKLKLGSEEDLDPRIYLKIAEAKDIYQTKLQAEAVANEIMGLLTQLNEGVYSKEEIDKFITEDIDLDGVIDKLNTYTVDKINEILETKAMSTDVYTREQANEKLSNLKEELQGLISTLSSHVDTVQAALETADTDNKTELQNNINNLQVTLAAADLSNKIALETLVSNTKQELEGKISEVETSVTNLSATHAQDVEKLSGDISANTVAIESLQTTVTTANSELNNKISAVDTSLQALVTKHEQDIQTVSSQASEALALRAQDLEGTINTAKADVESQLLEAKEALEASITETNNKLTTLQSNTYTKDEVNELINSAIADVLEAITGQLSS